MKIDNITGKFHTHITVKTCELSTASALLHSHKIPHKTTSVDLYKGNRRQHDAMLTMHHHTRKFKNYAAILMYVLDAEKILLENNISVLRTKIEHEESKTITVSDNQYHECHIKLKIPSVIYPDYIKLLGTDTSLGTYGWSSNPCECNADTCIEFINIRARAGTRKKFDKHVEDVVQYLSRMYPIISISEIKIETAVYDSNRNHDNWWA